VLAGSRGFIEEAWLRKQSWGGALRQSGILAAACLYALDHHVDRLAEDHALAAAIAGRLGELSGIAHVVRPDTNIVFFDLAEGGLDAPTLAARLEAEHGIQVGPFGERRLRIVTHYDVSRADGVRLTDAVAALLASG
jgi:threonine aldolase